VVSPLIETFASMIKEKLYDDNEKKWNEFLKDSEELLDNYHELLGIIKMVKIGELGQVNKALRELEIKVNQFLDTYDKPSAESEEKNGIVDLEELIEAQARQRLAVDLEQEDKEKGGGSQLGNIVVAMKKLEKEITGYRQGTQASLEEVEKEVNQEEITTDLERHFELKDKQEQEVSEELQAQVEQFAK